MRRSLLAYLLFVAVFGTVVGLVHLYLWSRLVRAPELGPAFSRWGGRLAIALALAVPLGLVATAVLPRRFAAVVAYAVYTWVGLAILLFFLLLSGEVVRLVARAVEALSTDPADPMRRTLLARFLAGGSGALAVAFGGWGLASVLGPIAVERVPVALRRFPKALSGFRLVQLTDLHIGPTLGKAWLEDVVARTNALEPDAIVITGDLVDGSVVDLAEHVAPLAALRARHGIFFVTGNHEYYSGVDEWLAELGRLGVRVLRNERVSIGDGADSFDLAGIDDWSAKRFGRGHGADLDRALADRDTARELVLLAHQPKHIVEASARDVGLMLSGHTHGGQIFPWGLFVRLDQPFVAGLDRVRDTQIYVSRGTGYWGPPMRVAAPPEITLLELSS